MAKQIYVVKGKDEDELVKNIGDFDKEIFATQPIQKNDNSWCAFVYVNEDFKGISKPIKEDVATEKQKYCLEKNNIDIPKDLTKSQASNLIAEIKKGE